MGNLNKRSIMTLYSYSDDPYSHRVRIVLSEKDIVFEMINVDLFPEGKDNIGKENPYKVIPTLVDRDLVLYKSEIIMEYLDERFPHPSLMPVYPVSKARKRLLVHRINQDWYSLVNIILDVKNNGSDVVNKSRKKLVDSIMSSVPIFSETRYFLSDNFSLVDCCIAPIFWRLPKLGIHLSSFAKPIIDYSDRIFKRDTFQSSLTDSERILRM